MNKGRLQENVQGFEISLAEKIFKKEILWNRFDRHTKFLNWYFLEETKKKDSYKIQ